MNIAGIQFLSPRAQHGAALAERPGSALVETPSTKKNIRSLALALTLSRPVLLQGSTGSGKTSLVEHLFDRYGQHVSRGLVPCPAALPGRALATDPASVAPQVPVSLEWC